MKATFRLPSILRSEKMASDLTSGPEYEKLVQICLDLSGMPFSDDKRDLYECDELLEFIGYWSSDRVSERLAIINAESSENGRHFMDEFEKLLKMMADLMEEVIDFEWITPSDDEVEQLQQQLLHTAVENRNEIAQLIADSVKKMEQMHLDCENEEERLQPIVVGLTAELEMCENAYKSEVMGNQEEIANVSELLRGAIAKYDNGMGPVYSKLSQLNEKIEKQQQRNNALSVALAKQAVQYEWVLAEQQRIWNEQLEAFRGNRAAKIIQRAYREFRLAKLKKLRKMKKKGGASKKWCQRNGCVRNGENTLAFDSTFRYFFFAFMVFKNHSIDIALVVKPDVEMAYMCWVLASRWSERWTLSSTLITK